MTSPDTVIAYALAGTLEFDPLTDTLTNDAGESVRLEPPVGEILPANGFDPGESGFVAPPADASGVVGRRRPDSRTGCSCSSRSRRGTATTTSTCPCS